MPVNPTYPGVYVEEVPSGVRTIVGVPTSITAFVGRTRRGPVNEAIMINNYGDFERIFGGLWSESKLGYALRDYYINGGSQAIIVRLFKSQGDSDAVAAAIAVANAATDETAAAAATNAQTKADEFAEDPEKSAAQAVADAAIAASELEGATVGSVNQAAKDYVKLNYQSAKARLTIDGLTLEAAYEGSWANELRARVDHNVDQTKEDKDKLFNLSIYDGQTGRAEIYRNLSVEEGHVRRVNEVLENESGLVRVVGDPPESRPAASEEPKLGEKEWEDNDPPTNVQVGWDGLANDGDDLTSEEFIGAGTYDAKKGLYALRQADLFNLLCIPPYKDDVDIDAALIDPAITFCEEQRAMLLIDPPSKWVNKEGAKSGIENEVGGPHKNAAIFFPRFKQPDPEREGQIGEFVPCGAVAGIFARTDRERGVWKAPAGLEATLRGVPKLSVNLNDAENGELNPLGINCLRTLPAVGRVVWGARTRVGDDRMASEWKYIPIRRLALFIEESLYRGTQWVVFEPNDEPLWSQIRLNVGAFMHRLFRQGAFQGATPREAYFVKCDHETNPQADINLGIVNIVVGFAPLKPAEFVIIKIQQIAGQIKS